MSRWAQGLEWVDTGGVQGKGEVGSRRLHCAGLNSRLRLSQKSGPQRRRRRRRDPTSKKVKRESCLRKRRGGGGTTDARDAFPPFFRVSLRGGERRVMATTTPQTRRQGPTPHSHFSRRAGLEIEGGGGRRKWEENTFCGGNYSQCDLVSEGETSPHLPPALRGTARSRSGRRSRPHGAGWSWSWSSS